MIAITAEEKKMIAEKYPNVHIVRTMKNDSKRHRYYCTEDRRVMSLLAVLRGTEDEHTNKSAGKGRKKRKGGYHRA